MKSISSPAVLKREFAGTTSTLGVDTRTEMGAKSFSGSYASFLYRPALMA